MTKVLAHRKAVATKKPRATAMRGSATDDHVVNFGERVKQLRNERDLTGTKLSERAKIAPSTLSKIENNRLSPTYDTIIKLARGLGVNVELLFSDSLPKEPIGRRSVTRRDQGSLYSAHAYAYEMLCSDISNKKLIPIVGHIKARSRQEFGDLIAHEGEEVIYVLSGRVELHTEFYEPLALETGDCVFFDSRMGHACIAAGNEDAKIFWVCSDRDAIDIVHQINP